MFILRSAHIAILLYIDHAYFLLHTLYCSRHPSHLCPDRQHWILGRAGRKYSQIEWGVHAAFWRVSFVLRRLLDLNFECSKGFGNT